MRGKTVQYWLCASHTVQHSYKGGSFCKERWGGGLTERERERATLIFRHDNFQQLDHSEF